MKFPAGEGAELGYFKPWNPRGWGGVALIKEITYIEESMCFFVSTVIIEERTLYKNVIIMLLPRFMLSCVYDSVN